MKEHGLIVATSGVQAIFDGRKTQTRRVMKPQPELIPADVPQDKEQPYWWSCRAVQSMVRLPDDMGCMPSFCPYGQVGDKLWVKETYVIEADMDYGYSNQPIPHYKATEPEPNIVRGSQGDLDDTTKWSPSIFMPRWASRITLEITGVRVERLQEIPWQDCKKEGVVPEIGSIYCETWREAFEKLWDSLNAKRGYGWNTNPWVWVITFRRLTDGNGECIKL